MACSATFLFHASLNDFLDRAQRNKSIPYFFKGNPAIKDAIEALGVPHPEVAEIRVNGQNADFFYALKQADRVEVFPVNRDNPTEEKKTLYIPPPKPLQFVLDVHLGKLARGLRMLGFDTLYRNDFADRTIAEIAQNENRIVLTRDVDLLKIKTIQWGYWLRSQFLEAQLREVMMQFQLQEAVAPLTRCLECNGMILPVAKEKVLGVLPPKTIAFFHEFYQCQNCGKVYWKGSHYDRMKAFVAHITAFG